MAARIAALADQCVQCGLCLPHCPTYRIEGSEGESPRGRIALARAVAREGASISSQLDAHLDHCLSCGACESVCPSKVGYAELLTLTRSIRAPRRSLTSSGLHWLAHHPRMLASFRALAVPLASLRLTRLFSASFAAALAAVRGSRDWPRTQAAEFTAARGSRRGAVALFRGCMATVFDADTQMAATTVLSRLGFDVHAPRRAHCCGALDRHRGNSGAAARRAACAAEVFAALDVVSVLGSASGCQHDLTHAVLGGSKQKSIDIMSFVAAQFESAPLLFKTRNCRVAWIVPCTQSAPADVASTRSLLSSLPGVRLEELPSQPRCCGASGTHFVDHPLLANRIREQRIEQILDLNPDLVLTGNIGCRLHLQAGLQAHGSILKVQHPLSFLAELLRS